MSSIAQSIVSGQHKIAATQYLKAHANDPAFSLDRKTRIKVANTLLHSGKISEAVLLYEEHLREKPTPDDVSRVALLLAAKYARVLDKPARCKELLEKYSEQFTSDHKKLADALRIEVSKT